MKRYAVRHMSCAGCAHEMERALKAMEGVREARIDFASATLDIDGADRAAALTTMRRIEPAVSLVPLEGESRAAAARRRVVIELAGSVLLFAAGLSPWRFSRVLMALAYALAGWRIVLAAARNVVRGSVFDENFLMVVATAGAFAIGDLSEAALVMIFAQLGGILETLAVDRSQRSIRALAEMQPDVATLIEGGSQRVVPSAQVTVGQEILVRPGDRFPLDGVVAEGTSLVDASSLTGESMPREVAPASEVLAGMINTTAALRVRVTRRLEESSVAKVMRLVESATARKARTERFLTTFARVYTPAVVAGAALLSILPPLLVPGQAFATWLHRALVMLVISCPCALVISVPLAYFGGIGAAARRGILFRGSQYLDALATARTVVFDKTGTLTEGSFVVSGVAAAPGWERRELVALAAAAASQSSHPVSRSVHRYGQETVGAEVLATLPVGLHEEVGGQGVRARVGGRTLLLGSERFLGSQGIGCPPDGVGSGTRVHLAADGRYAGTFAVSDRIKPEAAAAVQTLHGIGLDTAMLSGDAPEAAAAVASELGITAVHAGLLPQDKLSRLEQMMGQGGGVVFVGDGVNDAPVLARADVGIAMGESGADAAVDTADVVLTGPSPAGVATALRIARRTRRLVWQNIVFALAVKLALLAMGAAGLMTMWGAVFGDTGVAVLAILNSSRILRQPASLGATANK